MRQISSTLLRSRLIRCVIPLTAAQIPVSLGRPVAYSAILSVLRLYLQDAIFKLISGEQAASELPCFSEGHRRAALSNSASDMVYFAKLKLGQEEIFRKAQIRDASQMRQSWS